MRLRLFRAARMTDAMAQLRAALGPDAVILATRRVPDGVEVTAALDVAEPVLILPHGAEPASASHPLAWHNTPADLAARLSGPDLATALADHLPFAPLPQRGRMLLAGPPGAGKTASCAKLAARYVLAGTPPLVVTTDGDRAGAVEQLAAFTRVLGVTLAVAPTPGTLVKALLRSTGAQPVLVDTGGIDAFDPAQLGEFQEVAEIVGGSVLLVLPAGLDAHDSREIAAAYRDVGASLLLPTRFDIARRFGGVLAAAAMGLALTEAGTGPGAADGLTPITPEWLAARLRAAMPEQLA